MIEMTVDSPEALMAQASATADDYLYEAIRAIDLRLGTGYAAQHPELIAAFMQVAAKDFGDAYLLVAAQRIEQGLQAMAAAIAGE